MRKYTYMGIKDTPFAIGIVLPLLYGTKIARPQGNKIRNLLTTRKQFGIFPTYKDLMQDLSFPQQCFRSSKYSGLLHCIS